jgi:cation:H+ antiporter
LDGNLGVTANIISRIDGIVLLSFFIIFMYYIVGIAKSGNGTTGEVATENSVPKNSISKSILYIVLGLFALVVGGKWIVDGAVVIATMLGVSQAVIGLTIVAVGTSLPELATSVVAALKKETDIAVGNIVGSNIFNIFWILGLSAVISPLPLQADAYIDFVFLIASSLFLFIIMFIGKRHTVERWQGILFLAIYILYIASFWLR